MSFASKKLSTMKVMRSLGLLLFGAMVMSMVSQMTNAEWIQAGSDLNGEATGDYFGSSTVISRDGTTIVVGGTKNDGTASNSGHVRVYRTDWATNSYTQIGIDINGEAAGDSFGFALAISTNGKTIAVSAIWNDGGGDNAGHVRVFKLDVAANMYKQVGSDLNGDYQGDYFGYSLAMSFDGKLIAVGEPYHEGRRKLAITPTERSGNIRRKLSLHSPVDTGSVQIYIFDSKINQYKKFDKIYGENAGDNFGGALTMSGTGHIIAVGAKYNDSNGANAGHVRVYKLDTSVNLYKQMGWTLYGENAGDGFGSAVAMSYGGTRLAVGAIGNDGSGTNSGHVRAFALDLSTYQYKQVGPDINGEAAFDYFGGALAMSVDGFTLAVGGYANDGSHYNAGHVRVYKLDSSDKQYKQIGSDINGEAAGNRFGDSLSLSSTGETIVIGAPYNDGNGIESGHVRVYKNIP